MLTDASPARQRITVDGHELSYLIAGPGAVNGLGGSAPVVVLLHGLLSNATTWTPSMAPLAARGITVIALDLLGHGESDAPEIGYSLDDFAAVVSGFLSALGLGPVTLAGHSLGGAIAMQFAKSYPEQTARLVLVSSGGLGKQVHAILRAATLPGAGGFLRATVNPRTARLYRQPGLHRVLRLRPEAVVNLARMGNSLMSGSGRSTFVTAARSVITPSGQIGNMVELDYVAPGLPTLIVWSESDPIIPVSHGQAAHERLANSRLVLFPGSSHEPHRREPIRFADAVADFVAAAG